MTFNCPKCNHPFTQGAKFCQACGCNLESDFIENPTCPKCKATYPPNSLFCTNDGSKLVRPEELLPRCAVCNTAYTDGTKFCPRDGGQIRVPGDVSQQQTSYSYSPNYARQTTYVTPSNQGQDLLSNFNPYQTYPKASLGNRFVAALLDGLIGVGLCIPVVLFFLAMDNVRDEGNGAAIVLFAIILYLIPITYSFIKDGLGQGQSWGKRAV
ncbi:MAG TPA: zinc ribbon domain-containing protein, partial [Ferruginibacter sp.]|nr:zinc ribbon domain-containing protein [Ferruginibacter sp.]